MIIICIQTVIQIIQNLMGSKSDHDPAYDLCNSAEKRTVKRT